MKVREKKEMKNAIVNNGLRTVKKTKKVDVTMTNPIINRPRLSKERKCGRPENAQKEINCITNRNRGNSDNYNQ